MENSPLNLENEGENSFKVPENYFDDLEKDLFQKINKAYVLPNGIESPFRAPAGYFDTLETTVLENSITIDKKLNPFVKIWKNNQTLFRYAAALIMTGIISYSAYRFSYVESTQEALVKVETDEILAYLENEEIDNSTLRATLDETDLNAVSEVEILPENLNTEDLINSIDYQYAETDI